MSASDSQGKNEGAGLIHIGPTPAAHYDRELAMRVVALIPSLLNTLEEARVTVRRLEEQIRNLKEGAGAEGAGGNVIVIGEAEKEEEQ